HGGRCRANDRVADRRCGLGHRTVADCRWRISARASDAGRALMPNLRHETHYGDRVVRCFAGRPAHIDAMFREAVARAPDRIALMLGDERMTYRELDAKAEAVAANLTQRGFANGDRLGLLLGNCFEFVYAVLGAARAGIIVVPMSIRQRAPE